MKSQLVTLVEIWQSGSLCCGSLQADRALNISAGQYVQLWQDLQQTTLPLTVFPISLVEDGLFAVDHLLPLWAPGDQLHLFGPLGHGFELPAAARSIALVSLGESPVRLLPLLNQALKRDAAVTLFYPGIEIDPSFPRDLPPEVEIQPLSALPGLVTWADYLAIDMDLSQLSQLSGLLGRANLNRQLTAQGQVLIRSAMPCAGRAAFGICAIPTRRGLRLACEDGPVFDLEDVLDVAG